MARTTRRWSGIPLATGPSKTRLSLMNLIMKILRKLLYLIVFLIALVMGSLFVVQNAALAPLDLLVVQLSEQRVALWIVLSFGIGGLLGMLTSLGLVLRLRTALMRANRQLRNPPASGFPPASSLPATGD